ncbi:MAG: sorbosone dehydrogenase family protein, partial [Acidobacteriota bacterium]
MTRKFLTILSLTALGLATLAIAVFAQTKQKAAGEQSKPQRIVYKTDGLPKPFATESVRNPPKVVAAPTGAKLEVPAGFDVAVFSEGDYRVPRWVKEGPNGDLFLADWQANTIFLLRDLNKDGKIDNATERFTFTTEVNRPFGMAIQKVGTETWFYVGNTDSIVRFKYQIGQTKLEGKPEKLAEVPTGGHSTRDILFSKDGKKMYVSVGSNSN